MYRENNNANLTSLFINATNSITVTNNTGSTSSSFVFLDDSIVNIFCNGKIIFDSNNNNTTALIYARYATDIKIISLTSILFINHDNSLIFREKYTSF